MFFSQRVAGVQENDKCLLAISLTTDNYRECNFVVTCGTDGCRNNNPWAPFPNIVKI